MKLRYLRSAIDKGGTEKHNRTNYRPVSVLNNRILNI